MGVQHASPVATNCGAGVWQVVSPMATRTVRFGLGLGPDPVSRRQSGPSGGPNSVMSYFSKIAAIVFGSACPFRVAGPSSS